jgi:hypothetical protein
MALLVTYGNATLELLTLLPAPFTRNPGNVIEGAVSRIRVFITAYGNAGS